MRDYRRRRKAETVRPHVFVTHDDPITVLLDWSRETLRVPPGHPLSGKPMTLPGSRGLPAAGLGGA